MLKCVKCTLQRTLVQQTVLRTFRISSQLNVDKPTEKETLYTRLKAPKQLPNVPDEFKMVLKFPYIRPFALINRLKIYQTAVTGLFVSGGVIMNYLDFITADSLQLIAVSSISGCLVLYGLGYLTGNFIGYIYYNEKTDMARIAYADHWGRRKHLEIPVEDIIPISDLPESRWNGLYITFRRYSTNDTLKINTNFAEVVDKEALKRIV